MTGDIEKAAGPKRSGELPLAAGRGWRQRARTMQPVGRIAADTIARSSAGGDELPGSGTIKDSWNSRAMTAGYRFKVREKGGIGLGLRLRPAQGPRPSALGPRLFAPKAPPSHPLPTRSRVLAREGMSAPGSGTIKDSWNSRAMTAGYRFKVIEARSSSPLASRSPVGRRWQRKQLTSPSEFLSRVFGVSPLLRSSMLETVERPGVYWWLLRPAGD